MNDLEEIKIKTENIKLDQFLKWANIVSTGGQAKHMIKAGKVEVNGEVEYKRSHKIANGDIIFVTDTNKSYMVKG